MVRIQRLKEPKKGKSGKQLKPGDTYKFKGLTIVNRNRFSVYVSYWERPGKDFIKRKKLSKEASNVKKSKQNSTARR